MKKFISSLKQPKAKKWLSVTRAALALVVAFVLVWASGWAFIYQLGESVTVTDGVQLEGQSCVSTDLRWVMDIVAEETNAKGEALYYYAVAPVGNRFVLVRFAASQLEDVTRLRDQTREYITGEIKAMTVHLPVSGMVETAPQGAYSLLSEWFNENVGWMSLAGVVDEEPSAADYLVNECILVDQVGSRPLVMSAVMSIAAVLLALYAISEGVLLLVGYYKESRVTARRIGRIRRRKDKEKAARAAERAAKKAEARKAEANKAEEKKAEEQPGEKELVEEQPVEEQSVEEQPAEEQPVEEPPAEEALAEEQPAEDGEDNG